MPEPIRIRVTTINPLLQGLAADLEEVLNRVTPQEVIVNELERYQPILDEHVRNYWADGTPIPEDWWLGFRGL